MANPILSNEDIQAIVEGYKLKEHLIEQSLLKQIALTAEDIEYDTLNVLAWLIYNKQLEIKIAITDNNSIYHEKFGVFTDSKGDSISFSGSANETAGGLFSNFEKIDLYFTENDQLRIDDAKKDFESIWKNKVDGLTIVDIPESVKQKNIK